MRVLWLILFVVHSIKADVNESYFESAAKYYGLNPVLLYAIAKTESNFNPRAINCANTNGSCDYGLMQINSIHLPMLGNIGVKKEDLLDPKTNVYVGTWVLKNCIKRHGFNEYALNCYNGKLRNNPYANKVLRNYYALNDLFDKLK